MHLELVELLRCPLPHASSVLVAASDKMFGRSIQWGVLGCPECGAEYPIRDGVTDFDAVPLLAANTETSSHVDASTAALRVAAQLAMSEGRSVYGLVGFAPGIVKALRELVPARLILINSPDVEALGGLGETLASAPAGIVQATDLRPLVPAKFDGIAFAASPEAEVLVQAVTALKSGGRLVAPVAREIPGGMTELIRDEREWIAVRDSIASAPVGITRR
jgi:uncharacterized protein YbaR (Trm112 family)